MGLLSPPTVETVRARRWTVFIVSIFENILFAAPLFGWASLQNMLLSFGCSSQLCIDDCQYYDAHLWQSNYTNGLNEGELLSFNAMKGTEQVKKWNEPLCSTKYFDEYDVNEWSSRVDEKEWVMGCSKQSSKMTTYFTIATSFLSGSTMVYGLIMDKYGTRILRLSGMFAFALSCVFFMGAANDPRSSGWMVLPAVLFNGMGGILYIFTGFQLANFFPNGRSTVCALLIGSYNSSAIVYPILYLLFSNEILTFNGCMILHMVLALASFVEGWVNTPVEPIPEPNSSTNVDEDNNNNEKEEPTASTEEIPSFISVLFSIPCILSLVTMCITVLRLSYYINSLNLWFENAARSQGMTDEKEIKALVDANSSTFGYIQPLCILWSIPIGYVIDRNFSKSKENPKAMSESASNRDDGIPLLTAGGDTMETSTDVDGVTFKRVQQLRNTRDAYLITVALLLAFGYLILLQGNISIQIITFVLHTVIRTLIHSSAAGLYVQVFHMAHIGKLTGLGSIAGAIFSFLMIPFDTIVSGPLAGNPYELNLYLLIFSVLGALLPIYLHVFANRTENELKEIEKNNCQYQSKNN